MTFTFNSLLHKKYFLFISNNLNSKQEVSNSINNA